jgi:hypothetical protein
MHGIHEKWGNMIVGDLEEDTSGEKKYYKQQEKPYHRDIRPDKHPEASSYHTKNPL